jgi:hypothetical protein
MVRPMRLSNQSVTCWVSITVAAAADQVPGCALELALGHRDSLVDDQPRALVGQRGHQVSLRCRNKAAVAFVGLVQVPATSGLAASSKLDASASSSVRMASRATGSRSNGRIFLLLVLVDPVDAAGEAFRDSSTRSE